MRQAGFAPTRGSFLRADPHRSPSPARLLVSPLPLWWRRAGHVRPLRVRGRRGLTAPPHLPGSPRLPTATVHGSDAAGISCSSFRFRMASTDAAAVYQRFWTATILSLPFKRWSAVRTVLSGSRQTPACSKWFAISTPRLPGFSWMNWCTKSFAVGVSDGGETAGIPLMVLTVDSAARSATLLACASISFAACSRKWLSEAFQPSLNPSFHLTNPCCFLTASTYVPMAENRAPRAASSSALYVASTWSMLILASVEAGASCGGESDASFMAPGLSLNSE